MPNTRLIELLEKFRSRKKLDRSDLKDSVNLISNGEMTEPQIMLFLEKIRRTGTTNEERALLAMEMVKQGREFASLWRGPGPLYDKHGVGGIPGDSSSLVVVPLCAQLGLRIPKVSTSAITTAAGHADIMSAISEVDLEPSDAVRVLKECNGFLIWSGGKLGITPADSRIVRIQHQSLFDFPDIFVPSIIAKKKAMGSTTVAIDISWGTFCKIQSEKRAREISTSFVQVGEQLGVNVIPVLFHENQPAGRFVGPALQAREVLTTLKNKDVSIRFVEKALIIVAHLLASSSSKTFNECLLHARKQVLDGLVFKKLKEIARAQGSKLREFEPEEILVPTCTKRILSKSSGFIRSINMKDINQWASLLVGNHVLRKSNAGLHFQTNLGQKIRKGDVLMTFYACDIGNFDVLPEDDIILTSFRIVG